MLSAFAIRPSNLMGPSKQVPPLPQSSVALQVAPGFSREQLLAAMHCVARDGRVHRGARCIRHIGMRLPLVMPLALLLWVPGVIWFALKVFFMFFMVSMAKAIVPRYRYDQLMRLGWKVFLPISLAAVIVVATFLKVMGWA